MLREFICLLIWVVAFPNAYPASPEDYRPAEKISVLPILHVPKGVPAPDRRLAPLIYRHLKWTQERYRELLGTTFEIATSKTQVFQGKYTLAEYRTFDNKVGAHINAQHLEALKVNRFNCPYIFFTVFYNPTENWPGGRGGSMNGGFNTGGGTVLIASHSFTQLPNGQSTLQHELGHACGLPHVDAYRYPLRGDNPSIMAYNPKHHTNGFQPSRQPGIFIPEDRRGLAINDRVFSDLEFDPGKDVPKQYTIFPIVHGNTAGSYPGQFEYKIDVRTDAGETNGSSVKNTVLGRMEPSPGPKIYFNARSMWHSDTFAGEANIDLAFPFPVELTMIRVHSGHSGRIHPAASARVFTRQADGSFNEVASQKLDSLDANIDFEATTSRVWRLALSAGVSKRVVVRGIRFFTDGVEIFPPPFCLVDQ